MTKKQILAAGLAAVSVLSCAAMSACGGKKNQPVKEKVTNVYKSDSLFRVVTDYNDAAAGREEYNNIIGNGDTLILTGYSYDENWNMTPFYTAVDTETGEMKKLNLYTPQNEDGSNAWVNNTVFAEDDTAWYTCETYTGGWNEELGEYIEGQTLMDLYHVDFNGNVLGQFSLNDLAENEYDYVYANNMTALGGKLYFSLNDNVLCTVDPETEKINQVPMNNVNYIEKILPIGETLLISYYTGSGSSMASFDTTSGMLGEGAKISGTAANYMYNAYPSEDYTFVYSTQTAVFGYDINTDTSTELLNWINSDVDSSYMNGCYAAPNGTIYTLIRDYDTMQNGQVTELLRMTRIPDEEVKEKYILTYGAQYVDYEIRKQIIAFNKESEEYRITIRDYSEYNSEDNNWEGGIQKFSNDIVSGDIPDIMQLNANLPVKSYAAKGLFADLYPFMDNDPKFDRANLYQNILDAYSTNGKLYMLSPRFTLETYAAKSSIVGDVMGWNMDEMNAAIKKLPAGADPFNGEMTRDNFLTAVCTLTQAQFVDWETGKCSFDTGEFEKILEFAKTLPEQSIWETINWDETGDDFWTEHDMAYRNGTALCCSLYLYDYKNFWQVQQGQIGEKISFVGYPNEQRKPTAIYGQTPLAISSRSLCKDGAWSFVSKILSADLDKEANTLYNFSIFRSVNKKLADEALRYHDYLWYEEELERGNIDWEDPEYDPDHKKWTYWINNESVDMGMMTEEAVAQVDALLENVDQLYTQDSELLSIITEEASAFFSGQKSAHDAAGLIQNRASLYVNESR